MNVAELMNRLSHLNLAAEVVVCYDTLAWGIEEVRTIDTGDVEAVTSPIEPGTVGIWP